MNAIEQVRSLKGSSELRTAVMLYGDEQMCVDEEQREEAEEAAQEYLDFLALQNRFKDLEKIEAAAKRWRAEWPDDGDVRELEDGCKCAVCGLIGVLDEIEAYK